MTKSIKKIFAALLVVATLALMIPFSASADTAGTAGNYKLTLKISGNDAQAKAKAFSFKLYRLADINTTSGKVTYKVTGDILTKTKEAIDSSKSLDLLAECDKLATAPGEETNYVWDPAKGTDGNYETSTEIKITTAGIYYVRSQGIGSKASGAIVTLPLANDNGTYTNDYEADLAGKINPSDVSVTKKIADVNGSTTNVKNKGAVASANQEDSVKFILTSTIPGANNVGNKITAYELIDNLDKTLEFDAKNTKVYVANDAEGTNKTELTEKADGVQNPDYEVVTYTGKAGDTSTKYGFKLLTTGGFINSAYYGKTLYVELYATVKTDAKFGNIDSNNNDDYLNYTNEAGSTFKEDGPKVQVFTFKLGVVKYETNTTNTLKDAKFGIYASKADADANTNALATAISNDKGLATFDYKFAAGTYYVREIEAPKGYVLDSTAKPISIEPSYEDSTENTGMYVAKLSVDGTETKDNVIYKVAYNTKITVPSTGGMGTTILTICGASLIVLAGVMFVVLKKKKTSK